MDTESSNPAPPPASPPAPPEVEGLFVRNATGLVRNVSPFSSYVLNFAPAHPTQLLAAGFFFALALFPGGNLFLALLITVPVVLSFAYAFGLLTRMIPRTGGDYVFVGRVLHPAWGLVSSVAFFIASLLSIAFFGIAVVTLGFGPGFTVIGLVGNYPTLVSWGQTLGSSQNWEFAIGSATIIVAGAIHLCSPVWRIRVQNGLFVIASTGLAVAGIFALFISRSSFISDFNSFANRYTHKSDTYHSVITTAQHAGVATNASFSFNNTIGMFGVLAIATIYPFTTNWVGGELRQARSMRTANIMAWAGVSALAIFAVFAAIFLRSFGTEFMTAANGGGMPAQISAPPTYFFLLSAAVGNTFLAVILVVSYLLYWPLIMYIGFIQPTRSMFAYAFDGLLPQGVTKVSRTSAPYVAVIITGILSIATLYWGIHASQFLTVVVYGVLFAMVTQISVGIAAALVPYRRPEVYRGGGSTGSVFGIPGVTISGIGAIISGVFVTWVYLHYPQFGVADKAKAFEYVAGGVVFALLFYGISWAVRRSQGRDIIRATTEIPPE